jgi:hypothetical protein
MDGFGISNVRKKREPFPAPINSWVRHMEIVNFAVNRLNQDPL